MGNPSISSDIIGCNEIIEHNMNGFLIPSKNKEALLEKMKFSIENKDKINVMSTLTRDIILSKFEQKQLWRKTMEIYKQISK